MRRLKSQRMLRPKELPRKKPFFAHASPGVKLVCVSVDDFIVGYLVLLLDTKLQTLLPNMFAWAGLIYVGVRGLDNVAVGLKARRASKEKKAQVNTAKCGPKVSEAADQALIDDSARLAVAAPMSAESSASSIALMPPTHCSAKRQANSTSS
jgi:hypothetical protein